MNTNKGPKILDLFHTELLASGVAGPETDDDGNNLSFTSARLK